MALRRLIEAASIYFISFQSPPVALFFFFAYPIRLLPKNSTKIRNLQPWSFRYKFIISGDFLSERVSFHDDDKSNNEDQMIGMVDYHMHSVLSDGQDSYEEMVLAAIAKGLDEIGFSEHVCLKPVDWAIRIEDIPVMTSQILDLKSKYEGQIKIRYGIELDFFPGHEHELKEIIESIPVDYVIGSVHFIGNWNFDTDMSLYGKWSNDKLYAKYFHLIQQAARSDLFDVIGHIDIIKKFRVYPETNQDILFEDTMKVIKEHNLVVELNTGVLDRPCAEFAPGPRLLEFCYKYNIPMTLCSDAHQKAQIARHYDLALEVLAQNGFKEITGFNNRIRRIIRL